MFPVHVLLSHVRIALVKVDDYNNDGLSDVVISGEDVNTGLGVTKLYVTFADYFGSNYQFTGMTNSYMYELSSVKIINY